MRPPATIASMGLHDFSTLGHGLETDKQRRIDQMLRDYDDNLSLRKIPEGDPIFEQSRARNNPPHTHGVYERNVAPGQSNWAFTMAEMSIDERILARIFENDFKRHGATDQWAKFMAQQTAAQLAKEKGNAEREEARRDEMETIGRLSNKKSSFRHILNGEKVIIGDTVRPVRTSIGRSGR